MSTIDLHNLKIENKSLEITFDETRESKHVKEDGETVASTSSASESNNEY